MNPQYILAIDQGGQSSRVGVFSVDGQLIRCFSHACATQHKRDESTGQEWIEQDPIEILGGIQRGLKDVEQLLGRDLKNISSAGFSGQGSSFLCWNKTTGQPLSPVISWQDIRAQDVCQQLSLSQPQVQEKTGLRISPHYGASKMRWCLENLYSVRSAAEENQLCIGPIVSFIFWHLLDKVFVVDVGHAQRTLLWNLHTQSWDEDLLAAFGIDKNYLPECLPHNATFGTLNFSTHSVAFRASARDQGASLFAKGRPLEHSTYINLGTGAFVQSLNSSLEAPEGLLLSPVFFSQDQTAKKIYAWEATVNGAASAMSWLAADIGQTISTRMMQESLRQDPRHECYFLNAVGGLSAPYWRTDLEPRFAENLNSQEKILAWLESIIFQIFVNIQLMQTKPVQNIYISGGLSNLDGLCQSLADLSHVKVLRHENKDASLQGIAYLASGNSPLWKSRDALDIFNPKHNAHLQRRFLTWSEAMRQWLS